MKTMDSLDATPNDRLSATISDALVAAGLVQKDSRESFFKKFRTGTVGASDWKYWAEAIADAEAGNAKHTATN